MLTRADPALDRPMILFQNIVEILYRSMSTVPILKELPVNHDSRGAVLVDQTLAIPDYENVWALGDCASVPDIKTGKICPPTAQVATREAVVLAHNIRACLLGRPLKPFRLHRWALCA
jgi:NADH dehydrogenase FAD-containing subunit